MKIGKKEITPLQLIIIIVAVIIFCLLIYFGVRQIAKKYPPKNRPLPNDWTPGIQGQPLTPTEEAQINSLSGRIHDDIKGLNWLDWLTFQYTRNDDLYREANLLSDRLLGGLWNSYKNKYYSQYNETLTEAIGNEYMSNTMVALRNRLLNLNLN